MGDQQGGLLRELQDFGEKFKVEEDEQYISPYAHLEKATVLQEARVFHDPNVVRDNPRKCCTVIAQLLHLQNTGQYMSSVEGTEVFFGVTKLFMSDDASLRRMVYLFIKDVAETCHHDDIIIVIQSLFKDVNSDADLYRGNAMRVLARIVDAAILGSIERSFKQAIVDSSALDNRSDGGDEFFDRNGPIPRDAIAVSNQTARSIGHHETRQSVQYTEYVTVAIGVGTAGTVHGEIVAR